MALADLQNWLAGQNWLRGELRRLIRLSVATQFPDIARAEDLANPPAWPRLLEAASVLAQSDKGEHQDAALRVAQECLVDTGSSREQRDAAAVVLDMLANRRALSLSGDGLLDDVEARIGISGRLDWLRRTLVNSITLSDGTRLEANRFQRRFWNATSAMNWVSASAPTSSGKSFVVLHRVVDLLDSLPGGVVIYLAPTRALVHEVELKLRRLCASRRVEANVTILPLAEAVHSGTRNALIFTQERLHLYLARQPQPRVDLLVIDEAQKVADGQRGVLLQQAVERVVDTAPNAGVTFLSPLTTNPGLLLADAPIGIVRRPVASEDVTVNQNLVWVTQVRGNTRRWFVESCSAEGLDPVGELLLDNRPNTVRKKLAFIAYHLGKDTYGNLIYANRPSDAEVIAGLLSDLMRNQAERSDSVSAVGPHAELDELADLARHAVHRQFLLARFVLCGVAFHYGNMPLLLRNEIERLFDEGRIQFLVCTSTLIEGVNLACRSIFLRGPKKGPEPMSDRDFWNLAGRAGRWGRDRAGNIICVDAADERVWHGRTAPRQRQRYPIERAADRMLTDADSIIQYIRDGTPRDVASRQPILEHVAAYLMGLHITGRGGAGSTRWASRFDPETLAAVDEVMAEAASDIDVDPEIVRRNPGISPLAMQVLLEALREREDDPADLVPAMPEDQDALRNYMGVFARVGRTLTTEFGGEQRRFALVLLVLRWMQGWPLPRLIDELRRYREKRNRAVRMPTLIRDVMRDVEEVARFRAPKYLGCYIDVLRQHVEEIGRADLTQDVNDLQVLLEFGVSSQTELSLLSLGLSRTSAVAVAEQIPEDNRDQAGCIDWLEAVDIDDLDLPAAVRREIQLILSLRPEVTEG